MSDTEAFAQPLITLIFMATFPQYMLFIYKLSSLKTAFKNVFSSVQFSRSAMSNSLRPHELQHARPPCPSPTPRVHSDSRPSSQ